MQSYEKHSERQKLLRHLKKRDHRARPFSFARKVCRRPRRLRKCFAFNHLPFSPNGGAI